MLRIVDAHTHLLSKNTDTPQTVQTADDFVCLKMKKKTRKRWRWIGTPGFVHCARDKRCSDVICIRKQINQRRSQMRTQQPVKLGELCRTKRINWFCCYFIVLPIGNTALKLGIDYAFFYKSPASSWAICRRKEKSLALLIVLIREWANKKCRRGKNKRFNKWRFVDIFSTNLRMNAPKRKFKSRTHRVQMIAL